MGVLGVGWWGEEGEGSESFQISQKSETPRSSLYVVTLMRDIATAVVSLRIPVKVTSEHTENTLCELNWKAL